LVGGSLWVNSERNLVRKAENQAFKRKKNCMSKTNLMGEDGVTDSTGEISRPLETWFEKGPNLTRV
jgi:hypothetical protein